LKKGELKEDLQKGLRPQMGQEREKIEKE